MKNRFENPCVFQCHFFRDLEWIWVGFWEGLGDLWEDLLALFSNILRHVNDFDEKLGFGGILEGSGEAFRTVWGGIWEAFGRVWGALGRFWAI